MRVQKVEIENFKRFDRLSVDLNPLDCLVGANNSGKTTLLQALALFDFCVHHCLSRKNGHSGKKNGELEIKSRTIAPEDFYVLPVTNPMDLWHDRRAMEGGKQRRVNIAVTFDTQERVIATVKLDFNRFGVSLETSDASQDALLRLAQHKIAYLPVFSSFAPREERRLAAAIEDELARGRAHSVIRNLILEIKNQGREAELIGLLQRSFPALEDLTIQFDEVTDRYVTVVYREQGRPKEFDVFSAGSGFQQFLYLFGFILLRQPTVILLDEPDVHLHGSLQHVLLDELRRAVTEGRQVLFATHSRELIIRVPPENILSLEKDGARRLELAFDVFDKLEQLGSLDPTQLTLVQAYRRVVVVEDRTDRDFLSIFCRKVLGASRWQQVERRVAFCYSRGNPWKQHDMQRLRDILQQMIAVTGPALEVFVVADRDYHPDLAELRRHLPCDHMKWHVWERTEIENYLLCEPALNRLVAAPDGSYTLETTPLNKEFQSLIQQSRARANDRLAAAFDEMRKQRGEKWDVAKMTQQAREFLDANWEAMPLHLADAKEIVLPGLKRWLQSQGWKQFSDKRLAELIEAEELPAEIHDVAQRLWNFSGAASTTAS